jgi:hypothetical protein
MDADSLEKIRAEQAQAYTHALQQLAMELPARKFRHSESGQTLKIEPASARGAPALYPSGITATAQPPPDLARQPNILKDFAVAIGGCGVVGEVATAQTLYLVLTARLLDKPVSAVVKGLSASGKSFTTEQVVKFFPPAAVITMTGMSERSLIYSKENYRHRVIVLYEAAALREGVEDNQTAYFVRTLLSEGRINYEVTVRDPAGGWTGKKITKEGPTGLIVTTTKAQLHPENETRLLSLTTNDSREQTKNIFRALASGKNEGADKTEWLALQTWLQTAEHHVAVPYAADLAELVPPVAVRLRRDFGLLLSLIQAHAILHQCTRDRDASGQIVATIDDYAQVRRLVAGVISEGVGATVQDTVRETVQVVEELAIKTPEGVAALVVATQLKLDKGTVSRRLSVAASKGYIRNLEDKRGKPGRWIKGDPLPEKEVILPQPQLVCNRTNNRLAQAQQGGCTVAAVSQGIEI